MTRIRLTRLEITDGDRAPATLDFDPGLNVVSGPEDRGKTYAFQCLDYLFGTSKPPDPDVPEAAGYATAWLYFANTTDDTRGALRRQLADGSYAASPAYAADQDIPALPAWRRLSKTHNAASENISSFWLDMFGFESTKLRAGQTGRVNSFTVRHVAHLVLIDEGRMNRNESPLMGDKGFAETAYRDAFGVMLNTRQNPPVVAATPSDTEEPDTTRQAVLTEMFEQVQAALAAAGSSMGDSGDGVTGFASAIEGHQRSVVGLASELASLFARRNGLQQRLGTAQATLATRSGLRHRLGVLSDYYGSDLRRLDAIREATHYLGQLDDRPCPTCDQPWPTVEDPSEADMGLVVAACRREADKIRALSRDLETELALVTREVEAAQSETQLVQVELVGAGVAYTELERRLQAANDRLSAELATAPNLAERLALVRQRDWLLAQIGMAPEAPTQPTPAEPDRTVFADDPVREVCEVIGQLLTAWGWHYTTGPMRVEYDDEAVDFRVGGRLRASFGKAVRGLIVSAVTLAVLEYCMTNVLPHPGFVVLDSPLTAHGGQNRDGHTDAVSLEMQAAFYTTLADRYAAFQVIVIDNKVPPATLDDRIRHIRFGAPNGGRYGFFPT